MDKTLRGLPLRNELLSLNLRIYFDALCQVHPYPDDDPFHTKLGLKNLALVWENFKQAGAACLIIPRVIEDRKRLQDFSTAIPRADITLIGLRASLKTAKARLKRREVESSLVWHLQRAEELSQKLEQKQIEDIVIETDDKLPSQLAHEILTQCQWPR